jgi:hypothetical protein
MTQRVSDSAATDAAILPNGTNAERLNTRLRASIPWEACTAAVMWRSKFYARTGFVWQ